ncbi:MAG TPA: DUF167 domain-containing protein [Gemmatimonadaceae bacterium]|jgi:hypothetical protein|nr:DUF167 domain-containing protein [Gemmatimonadaceae bacterium]
MSKLMVQTRAGAVRFSVRVQPRASRTSIMGTHAGALRVRLQAPPVDGAANEALVELIARSLGVPKRSVRIVGGATARTKLVEVDDVEAESVYRLVSGTDGQE